MYKEAFIRALENKSIADIQAIPKSDLHNHAGRGGSIAYIEKLMNVKITPLTDPLNSLGEMNEWFNNNIKCHFHDENGFLIRVAAAFVQAKADNITELALSYGIPDICGVGGIDIFIAIMNGLHKHFAPETNLMPDLLLWSPNDLSQLDEILGANWFKGIDIVGIDGSLEKSMMVDLKAMSRKAHKYGLTKKAHIGEFGGADDVLRCAEELELDQIQHGIAAAESPQIMNWLAKHKVQLNICPTSNIMLKNTISYETHQIRKLFDYGVPVTINSDDLLIFNATVSQEYLNLYEAGLMNADELNTIRETGLQSAHQNKADTL